MGQGAWGFSDKERMGGRAVTPLGKSGAAPQIPQHIIGGLKAKSTAVPMGWGRGFLDQADLVV